jgi:hypothetical protein
LNILCPPRKRKTRRDVPVCLGSSKSSKPRRPLFGFGNSVPTLSLRQWRAEAKTMGRKVVSSAGCSGSRWQAFEECHVRSETRRRVVVRLATVIWQPGDPFMRALERRTSLRLGLRLLVMTRVQSLRLRLLSDDLPICALVTRGHIGDRGCRGGDDGAAISTPTP